MNYYLVAGIDESELSEKSYDESVGSGRFGLMCLAVKIDKFCIQQECMIRLEGFPFT